MNFSRYILLILTVLSVSRASGQALRDINYRFRIDPDEPLSFEIKGLRQKENWLILFSLQMNETGGDANGYYIHWEVRSNLDEKKGDSLQVVKKADHATKKRRTGSFVLPLTFDGKIIVARVLDPAGRTARIFYQSLDPEVPAAQYLVTDSIPYLQAFLPKGVPFKIEGPTDSVLVSYYSHEFPPASPPFAEAQARVSPTLQTDSLFRIHTNSTLTPSGPGLYLIQEDTSSTHGLAFRIQEDYPKFSRIENLAGPLVYICTRQEHDRLTQSKGEKKVFDRVVLSITNDTDRARKLIRNYFRRVELANQYFTSYKEGWKTDRGMIYIIFGLPEEVYKFRDREVWSYRNENFKITFDFAKAGSVFDPENYVLIRANRYKDTWYEVIDLWRNARF